MFKDTPEGTTQYCEACEAKARCGSNYGFVHICNVRWLGKSTEENRELISNVGMLRQWLNEDRITDPKKMVTNEELLSIIKTHGE